MEKAIRVLVANRPRLMREVILTTFADQPDIEIVGEVGEESEISESIKRTLPNFVVIALDHPGRRPAICDSYCASTRRCESSQSRRKGTSSLTTGLRSIFIRTTSKRLKKGF